MSGYLESSVMRGWEFLTGDVDFMTYGGKWYRQIDSGVYHVIELINMWDATGDETIDQYNVALTEIDLSVSDLHSACECCGTDYESASELTLLMCVSDYGQGAPMGNWNGSNYRKLLYDAKRESKALANDDYHKAQMARPVNKLGSTAAEYARGDFTSAMIRGIAKGDKSARIIGKCYGLSNDDLDSIGPELSEFSLMEE